ncbi:MAG: BON domain-containing protein [Chloroflexi bacterium]|nr:BON domain-containing protein [Chloroflexota bacterium]
MATMLQASSDERIQRAVLDEFHASLLVNAADIGVRVHDGIVTLTGYVPSYHRARAAE